MGILAFPRTPGGDPADGLGLPVAWRVADGALNVALDAGSFVPLQAGRAVALQGFSITLEGVSTIPAILVRDMPGARDGQAVGKEVA